MPLDEGTEWFQPSNLEVTDLKVDNPACNVIPGDAHARLNIRFNDRQRGPELIERVRGIVEDHAPGARFEARISGEAFLNEPGPLSDRQCGVSGKSVSVRVDLVCVSLF